MIIYIGISKDIPDRTAKTTIKNKVKKSIVFGQLIIKTQHFAGKDGFLQREIIVSTN